TPGSPRNVLPLNFICARPVVLLRTEARQDRIFSMKIPLNAQLGKGIFLVASPNLRDPNFRQTVVLLCEHGAEGALGVVVNRPTAMSVSEALPQMPVLEGQRHVLFSGGPVQPNQVMLLYRLEQLPDNSHHV